MKTKILMLTMVLAGLVGCQKNGLKKKDSDTPVVVAVHQKNMAATVNPYESIGMEHNTVMEEVWTYVQRTKDTSRHAKDSIVIAYNKHLHGIDLTRHLEVLHTFLDQLQEDYPGYSKYSRLQENGKKYAQQLMNLTASLQSLEGLGNYSTNVQQMEIQIMNDKMLPENDRAALLKGCVIARYSAGFWTDKIKNMPHASEVGLARFLRAIMRLHAYITTDYITAIWAIFDSDAGGCRVGQFGYGLVHR